MPPVPVTSHERICCDERHLTLYVLYNYVVFYCHILSCCLGVVRKDVHNFIASPARPQMSTIGFVDVQSVDTVQHCRHCPACDMII